MAQHFNRIWTDYLASPDLEQSLTKSKKNFGRHPVFTFLFQINNAHMAIFPEYDDFISTAANICLLIMDHAITSPGTWLEMNAIAAVPILVRAPIDANTGIELCPYWYWHCFSVTVPMYRVRGKE